MVKSSFKRGARFMCCGQGARPVRPATLRSEGSATPAWSRRDLCQPEGALILALIAVNSQQARNAPASETKAYHAETKRDIRCYFLD